MREGLLPASVTEMIQIVACHMLKSTNLSLFAIMLSLLNFNENTAEEFSFKGGSNASAPFEELVSEKLTKESLMSPAMQS